MNKHLVKSDIGILDLLTILFIALKLTSVIDWSWFLVLLPFIFKYISIVITIVILIIYRIATTNRSNT
jgi:hypothetical protein